MWREKYQKDTLTIIEDEWNLREKMLHEQNVLLSEWKDKANYVIKTLLTKVKESVSKTE